jgi:hypothetical protein
MRSLRMESSPCRENWNLSRTYWNLHVNCTCYLSCFFPLSPRVRGRQTLGDHEGVGHGCVGGGLGSPLPAKGQSQSHRRRAQLLTSLPLERAFFFRPLDPNRKNKNKKKAKMKGFSFYVATRDIRFEKETQDRQGGDRLPYSDVTPNRVWGVSRAEEASDRSGKGGSDG